MTTRVELQFWLESQSTEDESRAVVLSQNVFDEFERIDQLMSRYKPESELSKVNRLASQKPVAVSLELFSILQKAKQVSKLSGGAFDMTFASVGYLYDFRLSQQPDKYLLKTKLGRVNYRLVKLNRRDLTVHFEQPGMMIDLGGIAKGYAVDQGITILAEQGVQYARLSAGGDMRLLGDKRGKPWIVGIKDPRSAVFQSKVQGQTQENRVQENRAQQNKAHQSKGNYSDGEHVVALPLSDVSISTSGDYERFFIDETGERIHHILSPKTGRPVKGIQSVSVIGPNAITTDGLSTAIFVLGLEKGLAMIEKLDGIDVIIIDSQRKLHFSEGLMPPKSSK